MTTSAITDTAKLFLPKLAAEVEANRSDLESRTAALEVGESVAAFKARGVITSLGAGACVAGVYTATANGAMAAQDGLTIAAGDLVTIPEGTTNLPSAPDAGPYVVTSIGGASAKVVLTRPSWWADGSTIQAGQRVDVAAGSLFPGTVWRSKAVAPFVVGTTAPSLYPDKVIQQVTLSSGVKAITNVPIFSATKSMVKATLAATGGTFATTTNYQPMVITPGVLGTASVTVHAQVTAGVDNASDASVLNVCIEN